MCFFGVPVLNYHCTRIHNEAKTLSLFTMFITSNTDEHNIARILPGVHLAGASWRQLAQKYFNYVLAQNNLRLPCTVVAQPTKHNFTPLIYSTGILSVTTRLLRLFHQLAPTKWNPSIRKHNAPKARVAKTRRRRRTITKCNA